MENVLLQRLTDLPREGVVRVEVSSSLPIHCMEIHKEKYLFKVQDLYSVLLVLEEVTYSIHFIVIRNGNIYTLYVGTMIMTMMTITMTTTDDHHHDHDNDHHHQSSILYLPDL